MTARMRRRPIREGEAEPLARRAVELALAGDPHALKLCLDSLAAPRRCFARATPAGASGGNGISGVRTAI